MAPGNATKTVKIKPNSRKNPAAVEHRLGPREHGHRAGLGLEQQHKARRVLLHRCRVYERAKVACDLQIALDLQTGKGKSDSATINILNKL